MKSLIALTLAASLAAAQEHVRDQIRVVSIEPRLLGRIPAGTPPPPAEPKDGFKVPAEHIQHSEIQRDGKRSVAVQRINPVPLAAPTDTDDVAAAKACGIMRVQGAEHRLIAMVDAGSFDQKRIALELLLSNYNITPDFRDVIERARTQAETELERLLPFSENYPDLERSAMIASLPPSSVISLIDDVRYDAHAEESRSEPINEAIPVSPTVVGAESLDSEVRIQTNRIQSLGRLRWTHTMGGLICVYLLVVIALVAKARLPWFQIVKMALIAGFASTLVGACMVQIGNTSLEPRDLAWSLMWVGYFQFCTLLVIVIPSYFFSIYFLRDYAMWKKGTIGLAFGLCGYAILHELLSSFGGGLLAAGASGIIYGILAPPWKERAPVVPPVTKSQ